MFFYMETFGCQMNKYDSELMRVSFESEGYIYTNNKMDADIIVFNTCSVRNTAERRAISRIREARAHKKKAVMVLAGCMAQKNGNTFISKNIVDVVIGPYQTPSAGKIVAGFLNGSFSGLNISQNIPDFASRFNERLIPDGISHKWHSYVTITHGCDNYCTYCIVPYVRGKLISFPSSEIIQYIQKLVENGIVSITLLGQNVNQYGNDINDINFFSLLDKIASIHGLHRIVFLTSHPKDFTEDIIKVIKDHKNISRGIHLPLQSGSNKILSKMNRKYTIDHYRNLIDIIQKHLGMDYSISTDLIVGFPDETDNDFEYTMNAIEEFRFGDAFTYVYSSREGTVAAKFDDDIPYNVKIERLNRLIKRQTEITSEKRKERIGKVENVIIEDINLKNDKCYFGKTSYDFPIVIENTNLNPGSIINAIVDKCQGTTLVGSLVS
jgi:tRNA-2-methylthio-N6-dimethylallyladenosine synthase